VRDGENDDDDPMAGVTIEVTGDDDDYNGPFYGVTGSDGIYNIIIGEYGKVGETGFKAQIFGPDADTDNEPEWTASDDCHEDNPIQIYLIDWAWSSDDDDD